MDDKAWMEARAIAMRHDAERADDLAQDLAVAALEDRGRAGCLGAWLERVGRNAAIDRWRVESRRGELAREIEPPAAFPDPEAVLLGRERRRLVRRALGALPRPLRQAALARFHAELPFEEVARRLGTPVVTARTRVHRALAGLRARLGGLRAWFIWPGAHATALGLALLATSAPGLSPRSPSRVVPAAAGAPSVRRHVAPHRTTAVTARDASSAPAASSPSALPAPASAAAVPATPAPLARPPAREARAGHPPAPSEPVAELRVFVFDDDVVEGQTAGPDGELVPVIRAAAHSSLIEIRRQFVAEVLKSLEDL